MASGQRPLYEDDAVLFVPDNNTSSASIHGVGVGNCSTFVFAGGAGFTIQLPQTLSAINTGINVDFNNSNWIDSSQLATSGVRWFVNKANQRYDVNNLARRNPVASSFSGNWVSLTSIAAGQQFVNVPYVSVRFLRLRGPALTASNFVAYLFTDSMVQGV